MADRIAFITGITGQDGSYLTEILLARGYVVHGLVRRASMFNRSRIEHLRNDSNVYGKLLFLHYSDLHDMTSLRRILRQVRPTEVYHLAGQSHVGLSFEIPEVTCQEVANATLGLLEIVRDHDQSIRVYHASSSEIFGAPGESPQTESTPANPTNPYGCAKLFATHMCRVYREAYGLFVCNGIAYNHESPRRGENFVTRKITLAAARIKAGLQTELRLGDVEARRDWGYAPEYVEAMWRSLQAGKPDDYVLASGVDHSIRDFARAAFGYVGLDWERYVRIDERFQRPIASQRLLGDPAKAREKLGWAARTDLPTLARLMVEADVALVTQNPRP